MAELTGPPTYTAGMESLYWILHKFDIKSADAEFIINLISAYQEKHNL